MSDGSYIDNDGLYLFFTDERVRNVLECLSNGGNPNKIGINSELVDLFVDMGAMFMDEGERLELNQHHELATIIEAPHINRLLQNDAAIAALTVHLQKSYHPCTPLDLLSKFTGYEENELEQGVELLEQFNLVRPSMVMESTKMKEDVLEDADDLVTQVEGLTELFEDSEKDVVSIDELNSIVGELESGEQNDEDNVLVVKESEFRERVNQAASDGVVNVETPDSLSTLEVGTSGMTLNKKSDLAEAFYDLQTSQIDVVGDIQEFVKENENP